MCEFMSAIVLKDGTVLTSPFIDSHSDLAAMFNIPDDDLRNLKYARVEFMPPDESIDDFSKWAWEVDEPIPAWFDAAAQERAKATMMGRIKVRMEGDIQLIADGLWILGGTVKVDRIMGGRVIAVLDKAMIHCVERNAVIDRVRGEAQILGVHHFSRISSVRDSAIIRNVYDHAQIRDIGGTAQILGVHDDAFLYDLHDSAVVRNVGDQVRIRFVTQDVKIAQVGPGAILDDSARSCVV